MVYLELIFSSFVFVKFFISFSFCYRHIIDTINYFSYCDESF